MEMVVEYGIDSIDFREVMYEDGLDQYDMMYKTDHHWTTEAGFYAYQKILKWVEENAGISVDERVADFSNYTRSVYKNWHLGSRGQRTGIYYAGIDDYVLITPDFETSLSHSGMEGSFTELMVNYEPLENKEYTSRYTYDHVMAGASGDWINNNAKNDAKLLIVADSFGTAVNPYMILSFREVRYIYDAASHKLTEEYIEEYDPDIVVLLYYTNCIGSNDFFSFGIGEWESNE